MGGAANSPSHTPTTAQLTKYGDTTITYDAIGNPNNWRDGMTFGWQNGRQLASVTKDGKTYSFTYDSSGLRTSKKNDNGTPEDETDDITTSYTYVDGKLVHQTDGTNVWFFYYDATNKLISMEYNGEQYYYVYDSIGNIVILMTYDVLDMAYYRYDAWGKIVEESGSFTNINPFKYKGYYYDHEIGLYYLQSRYYDPTVGRFINADGFASTGQGVLGYNMFAYCNNNPVMNFDPSGRFWGKVAQAFLGAVMVAAAVAAVVVAAPVVAAAAAASAVTATAVFAAGTIAAAGVSFVCGSGLITEAATGYNPVVNVIGQQNFDAVATISFACTTYGASALYDITGVTTPSTTTPTTAPKGTSNYNLNGAKNSSYVANRGWSDNMINTAIETGKKGTAINRANNAACTAYLYPGTENQYVVIENTSRSVVQVSNFFDTGWIVDSSIKWD